MLRRSAFVYSLLLAIGGSGAALAASPVPAVFLGVTAYSSSSARDVNAAGRIFVQGPPAGSGLEGLILLPPQPGGDALVLACSVPLCMPQEADVPRGLGASGRVIGRFTFFVPPEFYFFQGATWDASSNVRTLLAGLSSMPIYAVFTEARHLNASDVIVGSARSPTLGVDVPVVWSSPTAVPVPLANLATDRGPYPTRISDGGAIIGDRGGPVPRAVFWSSTVAPFAYLGEIPGPGGTASHAMDLDEEGRIVGSSTGPLSGSGLKAVLWRPSGGGHTIETLPIPFAGGSCQEATAIEPGGWIAGNCTKAGGERRGVIWRDVGGLVTFEYELLPLAGDTNSAIYGLTGSSLAVGGSGFPERAVLWDLDASPPSEVPALGLPGLVLLAASLAAVVYRLRPL